MHTTSSSEPEQPVKIVEDATCTDCGCMCDDISLKVEGDRIIEAQNACALGKKWFLAEHRTASAACLIDGQPAAVEDGIARTAQILTEARYPIIYGLCDTTSEAQRVAVAISDWIGGCVDTTTSLCHGPTGIAFQDVGEVTCTLGEIRNRGDLILLWGTNPAESHPRFFSRYALTPAGMYVPRGRADRYCVLIDVRETESAKEADQFIGIRPGKDFEALWALRALSKGIKLDATEIEAETGVPLATWQTLMDRMKQAKYGVILFGMELMKERGRHLNSYALLSLARDMNVHTRFVCKPMRGHGNVAGADNVVTWQTGYPFAVNLARGYPRFNPGEYSTDDVLARGEADAALIVASDTLSKFSRAAREHLERIPLIVIEPAGTPQTCAAAIVFHTATYGINTPGTVYRMDDVPIPLRPAVDSPLPTDEHILREIERRVRSLKRDAAIAHAG
jgi:formylmethanofuran dehydrogenase subunit B